MPAKITRLRGYFFAMTEFPVTFPETYSRREFTTVCRHKEGDFFMRVASIGAPAWGQVSPGATLDTIKEQYAAHQIHEQARAQSEHQG